MKKYYQYFGLALIMCFSFYYTDKISEIILNKNPLMISINEEKENYEVSFVNAKIEGDYITPGLNGLEVNTKESYYKMQEYDIFNKYFLVYNQVKPEISLEDNKNKIIKKGNNKLKNVALILENENSISDFLKSKNIKASLLVNIDTFKENNYFEPLNNELDGFKSLENTLNLTKKNKHICVLNNLNKDICLKNNNYLVEPLKLLSNNYIDIKNNLSKGSIILITSNANLNDVIMLLKEINYKDLNPVYLSEIISEKNIK